MLGDIHPSVRTEEAAQHADAVVVGEADDVWTDVLADFSAGKMQRVYRAEGFPSMERMPQVDFRVFHPSPWEYQTFSATSL